MKTNKYRNIAQQMSQELLLNINKVIKDLSFLLSYKSEFLGKDALSEDERINDEASQRVFSSHAAIYPLLLSVTEPSVIEEVLINSEIATEPLIEEILTLYEFRKESLNPSMPLFDIHGMDKDSFTDSVEIFMQRILFCFRLHYWINDIQDGIQEYGEECYLVSDQEDEADLEKEKEGLFLAPEEMDVPSCAKELINYLSQINDEDDEDEYDDKVALLSLINEIAKK
ncbi:MAG: hypothetical protein WCR67_00425 [Bacilli bacterium]